MAEKEDLTGGGAELMPKLPGEKKGKDAKETRRGYRRKRKKREAAEEEEEEEASETVALAAAITKGERGDRITKELSTGYNKLARSQLNHAYFLRNLLNDREARISELETKLEASYERNRTLHDENSAMIKKLAEAEAANSGSKWKEVAELAVMLGSTEIGIALQKVAASQIQRLENKPDEEKKDQKKLPAKPGKEPQLEGKKGEIVKS